MPFFKEREGCVRVVGLVLCVRLGNAPPSFTSAFFCSLSYLSITCLYLMNHLPEGHCIKPPTTGA